MKIIKFLFVLMIFAFIGGFGYFAVIDVPVLQKDVSKEIPAERLFDD